MNLNGILPPVATPFSVDGELDLDSLRFNVVRWMRTGLRGLVVLGSNGEAGYVDEDEAERVIAAAREHVPSDRVLMAGAGHDSTRATVRACQRAARAGADAVLIRPPTVFKGQMTSDILMRHYQRIADASPAPVFLYNFSAAFGITLTADVIASLAAHENIIGLKESGGDLAQIAEQLARTPSGFIIVVGSAPTVYPSFCAGVTGAVVAAANVIPESLIALYDAVAAGDHARALALQRAITPLAQAVTSRWGVPALKSAMTLNGYRGGWPRSPLQPTSHAIEAELANMLATLRRTEEQLASTC
ncbi:MAG: dihydrodipicolinate synthase family protein [Vicinamibacterales bacterium]